MNNCIVKLHRALAGVQIISTTGVTDDRLATTAAHPTGASPDSNAAGTPGESSEPDETSQRIESLLHELQEQIDELEQRRQQSLDEMRQLSIELAFSVVAKILHREIERDQFPLDELINDMVRQLHTDEPITVFVNPQDQQSLEKIVAKDRERWPALQELKWKGEFHLSRGSCRVEAGRMGMFFDLGLQLNEIRQHLLENLNDAEIERRSPGANHSSLRRFPERRSAS